MRSLGANSGREAESKSEGGTENRGLTAAQKKQKSSHWKRLEPG